MIIIYSWYKHKKIFTCSRVKLRATNSLTSVSENLSDGNIDVEGFNRAEKNMNTLLLLFFELGESNIN